MNKYLVIKFKLYNLLLGFAFFAISCNVHQTKINVNKTISNSSTIKINNNLDSSRLDSLMYAIIESVPEIEKFVVAKRIGNKTIIIAQRPDKYFKYYWIQVGVTHPDRFEPIYNFYVTPDKYDILYYETVNDTLLTLKQWREEK